MQTLNLNENTLAWDCEALQVTYNGKTRYFETIWELEEYLDHKYGVILVDEASLVDEQIH